MAVPRFLPNAGDPEPWRDYVSNWMEIPVDPLRFEGDRVSRGIGLISLDSIGNQSRNRETEDQEGYNRDENSQPHTPDCKTMNERGYLTP
jgi:hypothetical protein